jgi:hypothetical protein
MDDGVMATDTYPVGPFDQGGTGASRVQPRTRGNDVHFPHPSPPVMLTKEASTAAAVFPRRRCIDSSSGGRKKPFAALRMTVQHRLKGGSRCG